MEYSDLHPTCLLVNDAGFEVRTLNQSAAFVLKVNLQFASHGKLYYN
jgi:hypothetical protein